MRVKEFLKTKWRNAVIILLLVSLIGSFAAPAMAGVIIVRPPSAVDDIPVDGETDVPVSSNWAYDHQTVTNAPTGFPNRTDSVLSFVAGTRTFSIAPSNGSFAYYIAGMEYTVSSSDDIIIADTYGVHFIYYDGDTLSEAVNPSDATVEDIIENKAWVATIYWNATDDAAYLLGDERHGTVLSGKTHHWLHDINGAAYDSGFTLSGYTEDTDSDAGLTFELTDGKFYDEDVEHSISDGNPANQYEQQLNGGDAAIPIVYKDDIDGSWTQDAATTLPYKSLGAGRLAYNKDDGDGTFSQVEVGDGKWVSMTLIATNDWQYPIKAIQGQNEYTDKKTAVEEATNEIISFGGGALSPEVITLYRFVLRTKDTFGGTKKTKIEVDGVTDFRRSTVIGGAAVAISHGALGGLANDDHAQYLLTDGSRELTDDMAVTAAKTIDGRDLSVDGTKLDGIEALADVTDAANVATAGALMDSGTDNVNDLHIDWGAGANQVDADDIAESGTRYWAGESGADVTDATNVAAAGALMVADLENPPTEDETDKAPTSEWAFDHDVATTGVHGVTGDIVGTTDTQTLSDKTLGSDLDFAEYKAIALVCDNGATVPVSPTAGQWYLHTPAGRNVLTQYDGSDWIPIISLGTMTMYVSTTGTDDYDYGTSTGSDAFLTVQYAGDRIPGLVGGDVFIHIGTGTFSDTITIQGKSFIGNYAIYIYGDDFSDTSLTIDSATQGTTGGVVYGTITDNGEGWGLRATLESGNTDGIGVLTNILNDSGQNFLTTCRLGMSVKNTSDDTWAKITVVFSNSRLILDTDIMDDGENYIIGWPEHKGKWITFDDATDTAALQSDIYLILENDSDKLTIVGRFDAVPAGADTAYISTLETIISGKIIIAIGQLGVNFYRLDIDAAAYQVDAQQSSQSNFYYCDIKSFHVAGVAVLTRCFIHKEDDIKTTTRVISASRKTTICWLTSCLIDGEGLHYSTASSVRGIDNNNGADVALQPPISVIQNFTPKAGVTNYGIYMRVNSYSAMWHGSGDCDNWIRFCSVGLDAALGAIGQYCLAPYVTYQNNGTDTNIDAVTFASVS